MKSYPDSPPVYSHNPCQGSGFPLLVLEVKRSVCRPLNEGFRLLHWHEELQFVLIQKGTVHFKLWETEYDLREGSCMFINSNVLHYITEKENCSYHSFLIPPEMLIFQKNSPMEETVKKFSTNPMLAGRAFLPEREEDGKVLEAVRYLDELYFSQKDCSHREYRLSAALAQLWLSAVDALEKEMPVFQGERGSRNVMTATASVDFMAVQKKDRHRIRAFLDFVHRNYSRKITLEEIAGAGCVSQAECLRCFKKYTGESPYQYLQKYRLQAGAALLETSGDSVTDIALQVQFSSASAFIAAFRRQYGMTPAVYRKQKREWKQNRTKKAPL